MKAEILAVGTEILLGQIANTNAQSISRALSEIGVDVMSHAVVGDNEERIASWIGAALARCDVLIMTGGLGPTQDDLTREALARATGRRLERRRDLEEALRARFATLGRQMAESNLRQTEAPAGATPIPNPRGTAPGLLLEHEGRRIYVMPGVPAEMEGMLGEFVVPDLSRAAGGAVIFSRLIAVVGVPESEMAESLRPLVARLDREGGVTLAFLPGSGEVRVRLTAKAKDREQAMEAIAPVESEVREILGPAVYGADRDTLESVVGDLLRTRGLTLGIAESVTGGMLSSRIVSVPGASKFLRAGYIAYGVESKLADLGVPAEVVERHGAVSGPAVEAMAEGARIRAGADLGVATSGEAGPDASEAPGGQVFLGVSREGGTLSRSFRAPAGDRDLVRRWASTGALNLLRLWLLEELG